MTKKENIEQKNTPPQKKRKESTGPIRDKSRTQTRLINAVGEVLQQKGYNNLTPPNISKVSGIDKRLVWTYFGGMENLIEAFFQERDFWKVSSNNFIANLLHNPAEIGKDHISGLLNNQFDLLLEDEMLQKFIHWELGEKTPLLRKIADEREEIGETLFNAIEPDFENSGVDLRAVLGILVGGIYYLSLHAKTNGSTFCGIDINEESGKKRIEEVIRFIVNMSYEKAEVKR